MRSGWVRMVFTSVMRIAGIPPVGSHGGGATGSGRLVSDEVTLCFLLVFERQGSKRPCGTNLTPVLSHPSPTRRGANTTSVPIIVLPFPRRRGGQGVRSSAYSRHGH